MRFGTALTAVVASGLAQGVSAAYFQVTNFNAKVYPEKQEARIRFLTSPGWIRNPDDEYKPTHCEVYLKESEFPVIHHASCEAEGTWFEWSKAQDGDGNFFGWRIAVGHVERTPNGDFYDLGYIDIPKSRVVTKGSGRNKHQEISGKKDFRLPLRISS